MSAATKLATHSYQEQASRSVQFQRETRFSAPLETRCYLVTTDGEISFEVKDISATGARVELNEGSISLHLDIGSLVDTRVVHDGRVIFSGRSKVVWFDGRHGTSQIGLSFIGIADLQNLSLLQASGVQGTSGEEPFEGHQDLSKVVDQAFKAQVSDFVHLLRLTDTYVNWSLRREHDPENFRSSRDVMRKAVAKTAEIYGPRIDESFAQMSEHINSLNLSAQDRGTYKRYFRNIVHPIIMGAGFIHHAFTKPYGYSGDFGLMAQLYEYEHLGSTPFEKFFHFYSCNAKAAVANRNRVHFLSTEISRIYDNQPAGKFRVASLACGPARELELFLGGVRPHNEKPIEAICVDMEPAALEHARLRLRKASPVRCESRFIRSNLLKDLLSGSLREVLQGVNVISCAGLFDYVSPRLASRLITEMVKLVAPGGWVYVGNVASPNPDKFSMEFCCEWSLLERTADDLSELALEACREVPEARVAVKAEDVGLNLFLVIKT